MSMSGDCTPYFDWFSGLATNLNIGLCVGVVVSYVPQYYRIIHAKSSEGFSPIFLLLGTTSTAAAMFNMITLHSQTLRCCRVVRFMICLEMSVGVIQVGLQWCCFTLVFVLYMIYYPQHLKYIDVDADEHEADEHEADEHEADAPLLPRPHPEPRLRSVEWRLSLIAVWTVGVHFFVMAGKTLYLSLPPPSPPDDWFQEVAAWATVLGVTASVLAAIQYAPQLVHTHRSKLVGTLSIPMMAIQTPSGLFAVPSILLRPGIDWTSWIGFLVAAFLQGCLLIMCTAWKARQRKLGIDDFGNPVLPPSEPYLARRGEDEGGPGPI